MKLARMTGNLQKPFTKKIHNGLLMQLRLSDHIQRQIFWYGYYERDQVLCWESFVIADAVVADIGANAGYYSLVASAKAYAGSVFSFEPDQRSVRQLKENIHLNKITNIHPIELAISSVTSEFPLYLAGSENTGMTGLRKPDTFTGSTESVQVIYLDEWVLLLGVERIDLIKMDIEGSEMEALKGMKEVLQSFRPVLFVEICQELLSRFDARVEDIYTFLEGFSYQAYQIIAPHTIQRIQKPIEDELVLFLPKGYQIPPGIVLIKS